LKVAATGHDLAAKVEQVRRLNFSATMTTKPFTLDLAKFDISDPNATTYDDELCKVNITLATLNKHLPRKLYPRDRNTGIIKGIRPRIIATAATAFEPLLPEPKRLETIVEEPITQDDSDSEAAEAEEAEVLELASKKSKKQKQPINIMEVVQSQYQSKIEAHAAINKMARAFEDLCPPLTYSAKPKKKLKPWNRDDIWLHHNGTQLKEVKCPCCQIRIISRDSFSAGHIQAESRGGSSQICNIVPICDECNGRMGSTHMFWFSWDTYGIIMFEI
jgi:5-methylcytosine-specific restriction endonuclease McrA